MTNVAHRLADALGSRTWYRHLVHRESWGRIAPSLARHGLDFVCVIDGSDRRRLTLWTVVECPGLQGEPLNGAELVAELTRALAAARPGDVELSPALREAISPPRSDGSGER